MSKLKLKYGNKSVINRLPYQQGSLMLANDSQQIYFDLAINGVPQRRKFSGIIYLETQTDRSNINAPSDSLYFVISTCKFYYYYGSQWKQLTSSAIVFTTLAEMQLMNQCDPQRLYLDQSSNSLYYGINVSGTVLWINLSKYDKISDYIGDVNIRIYDGENYCNVLSTQNNTSNVVVGNIDGQLKLLGSEIKYNGNGLNTANGLVQLNNSGKIPSNLLDIQQQTYNDVYFETKSFSVQNLPNNQKTFTFVQLGIQQPTIVQLLDDQNLIRDDVIPVYWTNSGLTIQLTPIASLITEQTGNFKIKYLIAQQYVVGSNSNTATIATKTFDPYGLTNNKKTFDFQQLGIVAPTMIQLLDDQGLIRDDIIPVYWTANGLQINFAPISQLLVQSGHMWQIKYLVIGSSSASNSNGSSVTNAIVTQVQFSPYGLTNNIKTFSFAQLNLTSRTVVQLLDNEDLIRDDVIPMYWTNEGLQINFTPIAELLTSNMVWKIAYMTTGGNPYQYRRSVVSSTTNLTKGQWALIDTDCNVTLPRVSNGAYVKVSTIGDADNVVIYPYSNETIEGDVDGITIDVKHATVQFYGTANGWIVAEAHA